MDEKSTVISRCFAEIEPQPIDWLWFRRLALGKVNTLAGPPGLGKTQIATYFTAIVTTGGTWADGALCPLGSVIFIGCEDDAADTIRPRLDAAGADPRRVHIIDWIEETSEEGRPRRRMFDVGKDMDALRKLAIDVGDVRLVVIDPISAYMGAADSHKNADVRAALAPMQALAAEINACIVLITHLNKGAADGAAISRVSGSGAFVAVARSAWFVAKHPEDASRRILTPLKNNIGNDREGFSYCIESVTLPSGIETSRVVLDNDPIEISPEDAMDASREPARQGSKLRDAIEFLRAELNNGPVRVKRLHEAAEDAGISWRTVETAKSRLGVQADKAGFESGWLWQLPQAPLREEPPQDREDREDRKAASADNLGSLQDWPAQDRAEDTYKNGCGLRGLREEFAAFDDHDIEEGRI